MALKTNKLRDAIAFALVSSVAGTGAAFAQEAQPAQEEATTLDRVEVTGSRIRRVDAETTSPVLTIDRAALEATGLTSVGDVLFNITSSDGGALRNITTSTNGSDGTQNISLRGLGSTRTLVLVNGRRWLTQGDGTVDLNTIPVAVVERIEVLKDGASATYGSDAIAGVINVITRRDYEGAEMRVYLGQYTKGDGIQEAYDFTVGANTDRLNTVLSLSYTDQDPVFAADRTISKVPVFGAGDVASGGLFGSGSNENGNFQICTGPQGAFGNGFRTCSATSARTRIAGRPGTATTDFRPFVSYTLDGSGSSDRYNFAPVNYVLQPIERFNVYGQSSLRVTDNINANVQAVYVKRRSVQQLAEVPLTMDIRGSQGPQWAFAPTAGNVFNPFGADIRNFNFRSRAVGPRQPNFSNDNIAVTTWLDGSFDAFGRAMFWDAGYSFLETEFQTRGRNYVNLFNLRRAVGNSRRNPTTGALECLDAGGQVIGGCVPFNVFGGPDLGLGAGVISRAEYDAMIRYISYQQNSSSINTTKDYFANLSGDIVDLPAGPLGFAIGVERRENDFANSPDSLVAGGGSSDNFVLPTDGVVKVEEYYAELNIPILADIPGFKSLEVNLAARRSDYDVSGTYAFVDPLTNSAASRFSQNSYGDTSNKIGLKWQVFDELLLRGTYSESFRAPSVTDLYSGQGEGFPIATDPCSNRPGAYAGLTPTEIARCTAVGVPAGGSAQPNSQIRSLGGGNDELLPENGETRSVGLVYSPGWASGLDFTLDWYKVELEDVISTRTAQAVLNSCFRDVGRGGEEDASQRATFCSLVNRQTNGDLVTVTTVPFNLEEGEVEGYDFQVSYRLPETAWGSFAFVWDNTYQVENNLFGTVGEYNGAPTWRLRSNLTMNWRKGDWDATWAMRYYSALDELCPIAAQSYFEYGITPTDICTTKIRGGAGDLIREENRLPSTTYHDVQVGYNTPWNGRIVLGGRNVFGKEPPIALNAFAHSFDGAYDLPGGGFFYMQYTQKF